MASKVNRCCRIEYRADDNYVVCPLHDAAPALLEALEAAHSYIADRAPGWSVLDQIEAAIAQAKGETL